MSETTIAVQEANPWSGSPEAPREKPNIPGKQGGCWGRHGRHRQTQVKPFRCNEYFT